MTPHVLERESDELSPATQPDAPLELVRRVAAAAFERSVSGLGQVIDPRRVSRFSLVIREPAALRRALLPPSELALGEAFIRGELDVEGDLEAAGGLVDLLRANLSAPGRVATKGLVDLGQADLDLGHVWFAPPLAVPAAPCRADIPS